MPNTHLRPARQHPPVISKSTGDQNMGKLRTELLCEHPLACVSWVLAILLSFLTMCIVYFADSSSTALGFSVASFTLLAGYCPNKQCCLDRDSCKVLCIFVIVFLIIETTGFVLPCIIHGATAYFLVKETYDAFSGLEEYKRLDKQDKGVLVAATIFSILSTLIVLVLEFFWCRVSCCDCCPQSEYEDLERNKNRSEAE